MLFKLDNYLNFAAIPFLIFLFIKSMGCILGQSFEKYLMSVVTVDKNSATHQTTHPYFLN
jgi:hypothetical protein